MADTDDKIRHGATAQSSAVKPRAGKKQGKGSLRRGVAPAEQTSPSATLPGLTAPQPVAPAIVLGATEPKSPSVAPVALEAMSKPMKLEQVSALPHTGADKAVDLVKSLDLPQGAADKAPKSAVAKAHGMAKAAPAAKPLPSVEPAVVPTPQAAGKPLPISKLIKPVAAKPKSAEPVPPQDVAHAADVSPAKLPPAKPAASPAPQPLSAAKPAVAPSRNQPDVSPAAPVSQPAFDRKDSFMDMTANFSSFQNAMTDAQVKAKAAFEKSSTVMGQVGEFTKGNVEAMMASSKILAEGVQEIGSTMVAEGRTAFEAMTGDIKELTAAKSPTDFLKLQSEIARKNFDTAVAYGSKNSETFLKLMSDAFAPISGRVSLAVEKARQVAPMNSTAAV